MPLCGKSCHDLQHGESQVVQNHMGFHQEEMEAKQ
jgi:hypothetical protein